jgi:large subunit ribosomal protein L33
MAKTKAREYAWLQCSQCNNFNYRTQIKVGGEGTKLKTLKKYCRSERKHTEHKLKKK